jgi:amino acid adenylation domain-containing protein
LKYDLTIYQAILDELAVRKIFITCREGKLHCSGPRKALTPELKELIASNKAGLIRLINESFKGQGHEARKPCLRSNLPGIPKAERLDIPAFSNLEAYYASFSQSRIWFLDQMETSKTIYQMPYLWKLPSGLQIPALQSALTQVVERHDVLRTSFIWYQSNLLQLVHAPQPFDLKILVLDHHHTQSDIDDVLRSEISIPFDLSKPPLLRALLIHLQSNDYLLLLTVHHIASDGWSSSLLLQELSMLYKAVICNKPSNLSRLPIKYADFAAWQRERLSGNRLHQLFSYWEQQLQGVPNLDLPSDHLRLDSPSYQGAYHSFCLDSSLTFTLQTLCQQCGATLQMGLLALVAILLQRYSSQDQFAIGVPTWGRNHPDLESLIGCFINTLVIRVDFTGRPAFSSLLQQVRATSLAAYDHQELPFEQLVKLLQLERNLSCNPLVQVMVQLLEVADIPLELDGFQPEPVTVPFQRARLDLEFHFYRLNSCLQGTIVYSTDLFSADRIQRMEGHLQTLLKAVLQQPDAPLFSLSLLTHSEQKQLNSWSKGPALAIHQLCVHQLFEQQVDRTPDVIAFVFENRQLTYQELNLRANQLAQYLQKQGIGPEVLVGICVERSLDLIVGLLGILKAGGAYIPLDPTYPQERLAFMLEDSQVSLLLTTSKIAQNSLYASGKASPNRIDSNEQSPINPEQLTVICLDKTWETINQENPENPISNVNPTNLAYILYTSGSTGFPKGVAIEHRSAVNFINWAQTVFNSEQLAGVLASTSICFDLSVFELFVPLTCGGKVILAENALHLATLKAAPEVTLINTVPSAIAELLRANAIPQNVQTVNLAGEPLSQQLVNQLYQQETIQQVFNLYGPSEATTYSTFTISIPRGGENEKARHSPSIGRPIANTQIYILDSHLQPVPIGVPGELHIGGVGLARGYLNRSELTEEKFIPNPFQRSNGIGELFRSYFGAKEDPSSNPERLYKTGDLARYLPDGTIEFLGRLDNQVKIRGFRIEEGEIEAAIAQHPSVQQTVVTAREDNPGDKRLVAYIVLDPEQALTTDELRRFLKQKLPDYMVPSAFVFLNILPLTPNGKIDRRALPAPDSSQPNLEETFVAPRTPTEQQIADIWTQLLKLEQIGIHDNFFALGGHSLLATQVISRLRQGFGIELSLQTLFEAPTVGELSSRIETIRWASQPSPTPANDTKNDYVEGEL